MPNYVPLVESFSSIISNKYLMNKTGGTLEIVETAKNSKNRSVKVAGGRGIAFTLDRNQRHPWDFIVDNPPAGIVKVCDAILITRYEDVNYIVAFDLKSSKLSSEATKQIKASFLLCDWLCHLLKNFDYLNETYSTIGVLCMSRGAVKKKTSKKGLDARVNRNGAYPIVIMSNPNTLHIKDLIELI